MQSRYGRWWFRALAAVAAAGWMIFIINLSSVSGQDMDNGLRRLWWLGQSVNIIGHLVLYSVLATLYLFNLSVWLMSRAFKPVCLIAVVVFAGAFATYDEIRQSYVVGRYGSTEDVLVDIIGAVVVVVLFKIIYAYRMNKYMCNV